MIGNRCKDVIIVNTLDILLKVVQLLKNLFVPNAVETTALIVALVMIENALIALERMKMT